MNKIAYLVGFGFLVSIGCNSTPDSDTTPVPKTSYVDESNADRHNLGWLGATSNPVSESIGIPSPDDPDSSVSPGAIVLREVFEGQPAAAADLKAGDVIVRVANEWLPVKDDPTRDFFAKIEDAVASGTDTISLGVLRSGKYHTVLIRHELASLDDGLPVQVERFDEAAGRALTQMVKGQNRDGSFGATALDDSDRLQLTSLVGLAFLAAGPSDQEQGNFEANVNSCLDFVGGKIDAKSETPPPVATEQGVPDANPGVIQMSMPKVQLDPLTCSYVLQFLAESNVQMLDRVWMKRIMGLVGALKTAQSESGGWNTDQSPDSETDPLDLLGIHTTNQAVLAIGMWERRGVMGSDDTLQRACGYLKQQADVQSESTLDRRTKAALSAGTAIALIAINCRPSDPFLLQMTDECMSRATDVLSAPSLACSGLLSTALVARASGNDSWVQFHEAAKIPLISAQQPDGAFHTAPCTRHETIVDLEQTPDWQAAHFALALAMQHGHLRKMIGKEVNPMLVVRDSSGEKSGNNVTALDGIKMPGGLKSGTVFQLDLKGEGNVEDQIREKLKEQGIDVSKIKIGTIPAKPDEGK